MSLIIGKKIGITLQVWLNIKKCYKYEIIYYQLVHLWPSGHNGYGTRLHIRGLQYCVLSQNIYFLKKLNRLMGIKLSINDVYCIQGGGGVVAKHNFKI